VGLFIIYSTIPGSRGLGGLPVDLSSSSTTTPTSIRAIFPAPFILGVATVLIIHPLRNLLSYLVDTVIIPHRHPYQTTIKNLSKRLTTIVIFMTWATSCQELEYGTENRVGCVCGKNDMTRAEVFPGSQQQLSFHLQNRSGNCLLVFRGSRTEAGAVQEGEPKFGHQCES
jgi:hypothetical protein